VELKFSSIRLVENLDNQLAHEQSLHEPFLDVATRWGVNARDLEVDGQEHLRSKRYKVDTIIHVALN
jgi:hypothetical protein